jgi:Tol biopolymer transport system component
VFNVAVANADGSFSAEIVPNAGIWASPRYSPTFSQGNSGMPSGYIAYLRARDIANSINPQAEYDLVVADRDGSNARVVFPESGQPGLTAPQNLAWSPDARQIAYIYQGNLWVVDVMSGVAHQLTLDGAASHPVWSS